MPPPARHTPRTLKEAHTSGLRDVPVVGLWRNLTLNTAPDRVDYGEGTILARRIVVSGGGPSIRSWKMEREWGTVDEVTTMGDEDDRQEKKKSFQNM